jgi:hypothetical protein
MENINNRPQNKSEEKNEGLNTSLISMGAILLASFHLSACTQALPYELQQSEDPTVQIKTNWGTKDKYDYEITQVHLPQPTLKVSQDNNQLQISGTAIPARFQDIKLVADVNCNDNKECLTIDTNDKNPNNGKIEITKNIRTEYVAVNLAKDEGEIGRVWHDSETEFFNGVVKRFDDKTVAAPAPGKYIGQVNIFIDTALLEAGIAKLDLRGNNNTGIHGPWSNSLDLE